MNDSQSLDHFAYLAEGNAKQARKRVAVDVLIRDGAGRALLVNPSYKDYWDIPGGMSEANESLIATAKRELKEELDLSISVGRLLVVDWVEPRGPWDDHLIFIFDGGSLLPDAVEQIQISDDEILDFAFLDLDSARRRLRSDMAFLLSAAYKSLDDGETRYFENHGAATRNLT